MIKATASSEAVSVSIRRRGFTRRRITNLAQGRAQIIMANENSTRSTSPQRIASHLENRRTLRDMGSPTQKMCMITPTIINLKENGRLAAADSGNTMRFMKK